MGKKQVLMGGLRFHPAFSGFLSGLAGVPLLARTFVTENDPYAALFEPWIDVLSWTAAVLLLTAGLIITRYPAWGRFATFLALLLLPIFLLPYFVATPLATFLILTGIFILLAWMWNLGGLRGRWYTRGGNHAALRARSSAATALAVPVFANFAPASKAGEIEFWLGGTFLIAALFATRWAFTERANFPGRALWFALAPLVLAVLLVAGPPLFVVFAGAACALAVLLLVPAEARRVFSRGTILSAILGDPTRLFVGTFALLCSVGTLLLFLPIATRTGESIGIVDAAFTAVSAVCVTGLTVRDTPVVFGPFGQGVILFLIQIGGLGMMTFSTAAMRLLGQRMSLKHEMAVTGLLGSQDRRNLYRSTASILFTTFGIEGIGAGVLAFAFLLNGDDPWMALWRGVFTAVSAFCNAGFAIQSDNLISYQSQPVVLQTVAALIIAGGLSPAVILTLPQFFRRRGSPVEAQTKLSLAAAAILVLTGTVLILAFEWDNTLGTLSGLDRVQNAYFQSVTLRTAGFNSIALETIRPATLLVMLVFMFIGGGPGGTAGGIKTTTAAVILLAALQAVRGSWEVRVFKRTVPQISLQRAAVVTMMAGMVLFVVLIFLLLTQAMPTRVLVFEVVSALGTVGLSIGGTVALDDVGRVIIMVVMFFGRVGPLSIFMLLGEERTSALLKLPEEEIDVG